MTSDHDKTGPSHGRRTIMISAATFLVGAAIGIMSVTSGTPRQGVLEAGPSLQSPRPALNDSEAAPTLQDLIRQRSPGARTAGELITTKGFSHVPLLAKGSPISLPTSAVPEPDTWAMMLVGFGFIGLSIRRAQTPKRRERPKSA